MGCPNSFPLSDLRRSYASDVERACPSAGQAISGQNASMTDVSIYVALITGGAGAIGAAMPQIATVVRDGRQAKLDRRERGVSTRQQACIELLRAAADLRTRVANAAMYHGDEMLARLAEIRNCAAAVEVQAASVGLLARETLAEPAAELASAATELAAAAVQGTDMDLNQMPEDPDFATFDERVDLFRIKALATADE